MRNFKSYWCVAASAVGLIAALTVSSAADKKDKDEKEQAKPRQAQPQKSQGNQVQSPKAAPQQGRKVETPQVSAPQARESQPAKAQPEERRQPQQTEKREAPQTSEKQVQPKPEKGQVQVHPEHPEHPDHPEHPAHPVHPAKPTPEKGQAHEDRPAKPQPEKGKSQPEKSQAHRDHPTPPPASKEQQVHARQPVTTLKPEQTVLLRPTPPACKLAEVKKPGGTIERVSPSNKVRERTVVEKKTGAQRTEQISVTGRVEIEEVKRKDGTKQITQYDLGREKKIQLVRKDGCVETTDVHYNRNGQPGARETIVCDSGGRAVSRTVVVQQNLIIHNTTVINNNTRVVNNNVRYANNTAVVRTYYPSRYGYVYRPVVIAPIVFASYYDPYWYSPRGALVYHPFHYSWGWHEEPWYRRHAYYWTPYPVYAAPCFWITDWLVAGYVADRYATATSVDQTREEVRLAREEAEKARIAAEQARDAAEIAEAKAAQAQAEARAERAEARAAKAEAAEARAKELAAGKPNPNATPIDQQTKDALKDQIEQVIDEKKAFAEQSSKGGNPVPPDVTVSLADPKHIFPVSKTISVMRSEDSAPAGVLTAGDLLRVEPGQEKLMAEANENTPITMRVITSKGEDDSVRAGTLVAIPLKELQEFDNEFRAKIDLGLTEANNNKEMFKKEAVN